MTLATKIKITVLGVLFVPVAALGAGYAGYVTAPQPEQVALASPPPIEAALGSPYRPLFVTVADAGLAAAAEEAAPAAPIKPNTQPNAVPDPEADLGGFAKALYGAATSKDFKLLAGLVLLGLVYVTRRWILGRLKWAKTTLGGIVIAAAISLALTFGGALASGAAITLALALNALTTAAAAAGMWQWLQKLAPGLGTAVKQ